MGGCNYFWCVCVCVSVFKGYPCGSGFRKLPKENHNLNLEGPLF